MFADNLRISHMLQGSSPHIQSSERWLQCMLYTKHRFSWCDSCNHGAKLKTTSLHTFICLSNWNHLVLCSSKCTFDKAMTAQSYVCFVHCFYSGLISKSVSGLWPTLSKQGIIIKNICDHHTFKQARSFSFSNIC